MPARKPLTSVLVIAAVVAAGLGGPGEAAAGTVPAGGRTAASRTAAPRTPAPRTPAPRTPAPRTAGPGPAAFPGAQGSGAGSQGGRGGRVFVVTSLEDAGRGTLRRCVRATGARTCVFAVGGIIRLKTPLGVTSPFLTVAGQTAPGGGILLTNAPGAVLGSLVYVASHDVTWRYTRLRNQHRAACSDAAVSECGGLLSAVTGARRVIVDHNSLSWNQDEAFGVWRGDPGPLHDVTFSMNLIAEGLASHSTGLIVGGETSDLSSRVRDIDAHHNLTMNNNHRNPLFKGRSGRVVNNVFYNQRFYVTQVGGGGSVDVVGNAFEKGPMGGDFHEIQAFHSRGADAFDGTPSLYVRGNTGWHQPRPAGNQARLTRRVTGENGEETTVVPRAWRRQAPLPAGARHPIVVERVSAIAGARGSIAPTVGASRRLSCAGRWMPARDAVDRRLMRQYRRHTGRSALVEHQAQVGGLPRLRHGVACADADADGMADVWEVDHGLSPAQPGDRNRAPAGAGGFTHLELFLSGRFPRGTPLP